jgi:hypothetical protein
MSCNFIRNNKTTTEKYMSNSTTPNNSDPSKDLFFNNYNRTQFDIDMQKKWGGCSTCSNCSSKENFKEKTQQYMNRSQLLSLLDPDNCASYNTTQIYKY